MNRSQLIDEFAELDRKLKLYKPDIDRHAELKKLLLEVAEEKAPPDESCVLESPKNQVQISAKAQQSSIPSLHKVWMKLGNIKFVRAASMTLKALKEECEDAEEQGLIVTEQTGPRRIVAVVSKKAAA